MKLSDIGTADIRNFIEGNLNMLVLDSAFDILPTYKKEQAALREKLCPECLEAKKCPHCGCEAPGLFFAPKKTCPKGKWKEMMNRDNWERFKKVFKEFINKEDESE